MSIYHDCRAFITVLGVLGFCLLMRSTVLAAPVEASVHVTSEYARTDGMEKEGAVVCQVPELRARMSGKDATSPTRRDIFADSYLYLYKNNQPFVGMRVYGDQCRIATKRIGQEDWYSVESRRNESGVERSAMSLVSPKGLVLNIFDESRVSVTKIDNVKNGLFLQWTSESEVEIPGKYSHDALVGKNSIRIHDIGDVESTFDWTDLRIATATYAGGSVVDNTTCQLLFENQDGEQLTMFTLGRGWLDWLENNRNVLLTVTYGTCRYDREMDSGSELLLYNAIPQNKEQSYRKEDA